MFSFAIAFLLGDLWLQTFSQLPSIIFISFILTIFFLLWIFLRQYYKYSYLLFAFILGFTWTFWCAYQQLTLRLPKDLEGHPILITGYIASIPIINLQQTSFIFSLKKQKTLLRLVTRHPIEDLRVGDKRQFLVSLKRIHGTQNLGGFDFEALSIQKGLHGTGYILPSEKNKLLSHHWYHYPIEQLRERLQQKIATHLPHSKTAPWLMALMTGERTGIPQEDWQILRNTGTNHLMAIAGLHIGVMAELTHKIVSLIWRRFSFLLLWLPAQLAGVYGALLMAILYSALAGFSLPTERACIMLIIFSMTLLARRKIHSWHAWSFALLIVLLFNPLSVLTESFWLSFATIALIMYGMSGRLSISNLWWKWGGL